MNSVRYGNPIRFNYRRDFPTMRLSVICVLAALVCPTTGLLQQSHYLRNTRAAIGPVMSAPVERSLTAAAAAITAFSAVQAAQAARYMAPPMFSPFGFGFSPFGFSPFGFGFGLPLPLVLLAVGGLALTSFRSSRGIEASDQPGAALCLQVACYCDDRQNSLFGKLNKIASSADTDSELGLQSLVSDTCLAILRSSKDWLAARTESEIAGLLKNDVDAAYNRLVVTERSKWEVEQKALKRTAPGQPTYMVATLVVLLRSAQPLKPISQNGDLRDALQNLAAAVSVDDNLLAAEVLWTPEDTNDVMDRDELFLNFPELVSV
jgi:uncharacterized membrane protein